MDPIRNPYAPGAGQRPPELAGRDRELKQFAVTLERVAAGRPDRSMVLSGLRGVGKTVLLNSLRSLAVQARLGHRQDRGAARPVPAAPAGPGGARRGPRGRPTGTATPTGSTRSPAYSSRSRCAPSSRTARPAAAEPLAAADRRRCATKGRADSGDLELDLIELFTDVAALAGDLGRRHRAVHRRDAGHPRPRARRAVRRLPRDQPAGRAPDRRRRRAAAPARRARRLEVVRRAAVPLRRRRPAAPRDGRARLDAAGGDART